MSDRLIKQFGFGLFLLGLFVSIPVMSSDQMELKAAEFNFYNQEVNRPTKIRFWYQSATASCEAKMCLAETQNPKQIALISHGAFGSPRDMNWLGYALASQGWIVAGVAHHGESWVYGPETIEPSTAARFWQRPQDISFAIDTLASSGLFDKAIRNHKVLMLGHSSGGFTTLALAGAKLAAGKSEAYCSSEKAKNDKGCVYGKQKQKKPMSAEMIRKIDFLQQQMHDQRIAAVIALDPALGHAVSEQSLKRIDVPTLVLGSVENDFLPFTAHAQYYAKYISGARLVGLEQGAGHFVYIDQCQSNRAVHGVPLCKDRVGVDRQVIQKQILNHVFGFIHQNKLI